MKRIMGRALWIWFLMAASVMAGEKKALFIMLDGLRADAMFSAATPNIDSLRDGSWANDICPGKYRGAWTFQAHTNLDSPPNSATNHVAMATGVTATKNRVFQNGETAQGAYNEYPTWLTRLHQDKPGTVTAWLHNWSENTAIPTDANFHSTCGEGFEGDQKLIDQAKEVLAGTLPETEGLNGTCWKPGMDVDAMMLYLDSLDMFGHRFGFSVNCNEYFEKVSFYDGRIGEILATIKKRPNFSKEDWMVIVVADHGGIGRGHGVVGCKNCYTIPLVVSAKDIPSGRMLGQPLNCVVTAYLMKHLTGRIPECFDGVIPSVQPEPAPDIQKGQIAQLSKNQPEGDLTFTLWFKANGAQKGDPPLISNKDWESGLNPGIALAANMNDGADGCRAWLNLGDGEQREDFRPLEYSPNEWTFLAVTLCRKENAVLYVGGQNGRLSFVSHDITKFKTLVSGMDWAIGQDGTGKYPHTPNGEIQNVRFWDRALTVEEISQLYRQAP